MNFEIGIDGKVRNFLCLHRSLSQTRDIFEIFADNFELILDALVNKNPFLIVALRDFNAEATNWYKSDTYSYKGLNMVLKYCKNTFLYSLFFYLKNCLYSIKIYLCLKIFIFKRIFFRIKNIFLFSQKKCVQ